MGTYTTNYNLFMPTVGEQGWGDLVNGNFTTIDTTMAGLNTRVGTLETETDAVEERVTKLEAGNFNTVNVGTLKFDSIVMPTLSYSGTYQITLEPVYSTAGTVGCTGVVPIYSSPFPISGKVSIKYSGNSGNTLHVVSSNGITTTTLTTIQTEYTVSNAFNIYVQYTNAKASGGGVAFTIGRPILVY